MDMKNSFLNSHSVTVKLVVIGVLALLMIIPVEMIKSMIREREQNKTAEQTELNRKWGGTQKITGPILVVPAKTKNTVKHYYFTPETYNITGNINTEERTRGIQKILSYKSDMKVNGEFKFPDFKQLNPDEIYWNKAYIVLGISNLQGVKNKLVLNLNGKAAETTEHMNADDRNNLKTNGLAIKIPLEIDKSLKFDFDLVLNGTNGLHITPIGKISDINLISDWKSVSYIGDIVPNEEKGNEKGGFDARWNLFEYNRNFISMWSDSSIDLSDTEVGVDLLLPLDHYQQTMRAVKYALLFIVLTFLVFFMIEILGYRSIHPIQYLLVSLALVLFYSLLLAISEHTGFTLSYIISSIATILLITIYSKSIFKNIKQTLFMGVFLCILYTFLYVVLQQEDMALLLGSIGLFVTLAIVMYASRKVDWYKKDERENKTEVK